MEKERNYRIPTVRINGRSAGFESPDRIAVANIPRSKPFRYTGEGHLKVGWFRQGTGLLRVDRLKMPLDGSNFYLTNPGETYSILRPVEAQNETLLVSFSQDVVAEALGEDIACPLFAKRVFCSQGRVGARLGRLYEMAIAGSDAMQTEAAYYGLIAEIHELAVKTDSLSGKLCARRCDTREDVSRRILLAHDYAQTHLHDPLTLADLSRVACLSRTHFCRAFVDVFGSAPHQAIRRMRVDRAQWLLRHTSLEVREVAVEVGFANASSFTEVFRREVGDTPSVYRLEHRAKVFTLGTNAIAG